MTPVMAVSFKSRDYRWTELVRCQQTNPQRLSAGAIWLAALDPLPSFAWANKAARS